jgi:hypothetical protein
VYANGADGPVRPAAVSIIGEVDLVFRHTLHRVPYSSLKLHLQSEGDKSRRLWRRNPKHKMEAPSAPPAISVDADALPVERCPSQGSRAAGAAKQRSAPLTVSLDAQALPATRLASQGARAAGSARTTHAAGAAAAKVAELSVQLTAPQTASVRAPSQGSRAAGFDSRRG